MARISRLILFASLFSAGLVSAQPGGQQLTLSAPAPGPVTGVSSTSTVHGNGDYCYWVVAIYPIGKSLPAGPTCVFGADLATGSVTVRWNPATGATAYDVLRTAPGASLPTGAAAIAVATSVTGNSATDAGGALSSYTVSTGAPATANFWLNNRDNAQARIYSNTGFQNLKLYTLTFGDGTTQTTAGGGSALPGQAGNDFNLTVTTTGTTNDTLNVAAGNFVAGVNNVTQAACTYQITAGTGTGTWALYETGAGAQALQISSAAGLSVTATGTACGVNQVVTPAFPTTQLVKAISTGTITAGTPSSWALGSPVNYASLTTGWYVQGVSGDINCTPANGTVTCDTGTNVPTISGNNAFTGLNDFTNGTVAGIVKTFTPQVSPATPTAAWQCSTDAGTYNGGASAQAVAGSPCYLSGITLPAGTLSNAKSLECSVGVGYTSGTTPPVITYLLALDSTIIWADSGQSTLTASVTNQGIFGNWTLALNGSGSLFTQGRGPFAPASTSATWRNGKAQPVTVTAGSSHVLQFGVQYTAITNPGNNTWEQFFVCKANY